MRFDGKNWLAAEPPRVKPVVTQKIVKPAEEEKPREKPLETVSDP
jgi:hypothetical protein